MWKRSEYLSVKSFSSGSLLLGSDGDDGVLLYVSSSAAYTKWLCRDEMEAAAVGRRHLLFWCA